MERPTIKIREFWQKLRIAFKDNYKKNMINIGLMIYYMVFAFLTLLTLLITFELSYSTFFKVLILCLNLPVFVVLSLILVGKWKGGQVHAEMIEKVYEIQLELELKKQEIENLKLLQQQAAIIGDLSEQLSRVKEDYKKELDYVNELATYKILLAAKDGKVPDVVCRVKDWNDSNKTIEIIERKEASKDDVPTE